MTLINYSVYAGLVEQGIINAIMSLGRIHDTTVDVEGVILSTSLHTINRWVENTADQGAVAKPKVQ